MTATKAMKDAVALTAKLRRAARGRTSHHMRESTGTSGHTSAVFQLVQSSAIAFHKADVNGDQQLDFNEFVNVIPNEIRSGQHDEKLLRELFNGADLDKDGVISRDEFFFWTLSWCQDHCGVMSGIEDSFRRYDSSGDGVLNMREFTMAVEGFGFGELGHAVFGELDKDECAARPPPSSTTIHHLSPPPATSRACTLPEPLTPVTPRVRVGVTLS